MNTKGRQLPHNVTTYYRTELGVCVTVHHQYNDVSIQQDATTFSFINLLKSALQPYSSSHVVLAINRSPVSGTSSCDQNSLVVRIKGDSQLNFVIFCCVALMRDVSTHIQEATIKAN